MTERIKWHNLSGWLKFAFIWTLIQAGAAAAYLLLYAIIGIASLE